MVHQSKDSPDEVEVCIMCGGDTLHAGLTHGKAAGANCRIPASMCKKQLYITTGSKNAHHSKALT